MKTKLLKPPEKNKEIIFLPNFKKFMANLKEESRVGVCHQPYFFNPGTSLKFIFLEALPKAAKKIIFLDTDWVKLEVRIPSQGSTQLLEFINSEKVLVDYPSPQTEVFNKFFMGLEESLRKEPAQEVEAALLNFLRFKGIFLKNSRKKFLKEILAETFLQFFNIKKSHCFLSDLIKGSDFKEFFFEIYHQSDLFRLIFNNTLDEFREKFRFRFKHFPFPKLEAQELPFWVIKDGKKIRCFKEEINPEEFKKFLIFPRAATLTIFLRLYQLDFFIHGVGGANYEWIQDRLIERFFKQTPRSYAVISGTFLIGNLKERNLPYFLFSPEEIKKSLDSFIQTKVG